MFRIQLMGLLSCLCTLFAQESLEDLQNYAFAEMNEQLVQITTTPASKVTYDNSIGNLAKGMVGLRNAYGRILDQAHQTIRTEVAVDIVSKNFRKYVKHYIVENELLQEVIYNFSLQNIDSDYLCSQQKQLMRYALEAPFSDFILTLLESMMLDHQNKSI